jgi:hypothetical protein
MKIQFKQLLVFVCAILRMATALHKCIQRRTDRQIFYFTVNYMFFKIAGL